MVHEGTNVVSVANASEVIKRIRENLKKASGTVPDDSTDYVYTFDVEVRASVIGWKNDGWNVYFRPGTDFLFHRAQFGGAAGGESAMRSRNRKYEIAKTKAKRLRVYAEWRARRAIYDAIEAIVDAKDLGTLAELKRSVLRQARKVAATKGLDLKPNHFYAANDSVFQVALSVGVFRADGGRSIGHRDVPHVVQVTGIDADFRDRCDLFILERVINALGDVTDEHCLPLAHLMYGEGVGEADGGVSLETLEEKVSDLMKRFGSRLRKNEKGYYHVTPDGGEKVQSISATSL
jgi:hypothetical protein